MLQAAASRRQFVDRRSTRRTVLVVAFVMLANIPSAFGIREEELVRLARQGARTRLEQVPLTRRQSVDLGRKKHENGREKQKASSRFATSHPPARFVRCRRDETKAKCPMPTSSFSMMLGPVP